MTLLIITRKVDQQDSLAGFIYNWVKKIGDNVDKLIVICQEQGDISGLPENIVVHSLGKEKQYSKLRQLIRLKLLLIKLIPQADGVFAHMMPIYSIIAGPFCKLFRKKLIQWYMHKSVDFKLKLANIFVSEFATASKESFRLKTKKKINILGHGIDTGRFAPSSKMQAPRYKQTSNGKFQIITIGRISPTKDYETMIKAVYDLKDNNIKLNIVGGAGLPEQESYLNSLKVMVTNMKLENQIKFIGPIPHLETLTYLQSADLFINLSETGSLDKTVLEAMATETLVLTSNEAFKSILPTQLFTTKDNPAVLAEKIKALISLPASQQQQLTRRLRQQVVEHHNLDKLVLKIIKLYK